MNLTTLTFGIILKLSFVLSVSLQIWQHCDCVNVEPSSAKRDDIKYCCELCDPRAVDKVCFTLMYRSC